MKSVLARTQEDCLGSRAESIRHRVWYGLRLLLQFEAVFCVLCFYIAPLVMIKDIRSKPKPSPDVVSAGRFRTSDNAQIYSQRVSCWSYRLKPILLLWVSLGDLSCWGSLRSVQWVCEYASTQAYRSQNSAVEVIRPGESERKKARSGSKASNWIASSLILCASLSFVLFLLFSARFACSVTVGTRSPASAFVAAWTSKRSAR